MAGGYAGSIVRFRSDPAQLHLRWRFLGYRNSEPRFQASNSDYIGRTAAVTDRHSYYRPYAQEKDANANVDASSCGDEHVGDD
jgi:hypothetical protein